jgi:hypothetical protein
VALQCNDGASARARFIESLAIVRELGDRLAIAEALEGVAAAAARLGRGFDAARLWGSAERLRETIGAPLHAGERPRHQALVATARAACGDAAGTDFSAAWAQGRSMPLEQAMDLASSGGA